VFFTFITIKNSSLENETVISFIREPSSKEEAEAKHREAYDHYFVVKKVFGV
jgi:hypothetical protein